jgi:BASS family bile acid:Na+ symporter
MKRMKLYQFAERYFWLFLIIGIIAGMVFPVCNDLLMSLLKPFLMVMLFLVFLKTDISQIFHKMKNYRFMMFIVLMNMIVIPVLFYFPVKLLDDNLALGILLLAAMPAGVATPALTDLIKGNTALSAGIVIATSLIAPFTVPLLFWVIGINDISVDPRVLFKDLSLIIFVPMILSQAIKHYFPQIIDRTNHLFTSVNVVILAILVYTVMGSQRDIILSNPVNLIWHTGFLYLVFMLLHLLGFLMGYSQDLEGKIATTIGAAYMNNGLAIVLAAVYFEPSILFLMVLSELPWNTLLIPFKRVIKYL